VFEGSTEICWENNCTSLSVVDKTCLGPSCIAFGDECTFDTCHASNMQECDKNENCVFSSDSACHYGTCEDIGENESDCNLNDKCVFVNGHCANSCSSFLSCDLAYCYDKDSVCTYDRCSSKKISECDRTVGCIWDNSLSFNNSEGLCKSGSCEDLTEQDCVKDFNNNKCGYMNGKCQVNICGSISSDECDTTRGCELSNGKCVVDECMKFVDSVCKEGQTGKNCIFNDNKCVKGNCDILDRNECEINNRCEIINTGEETCWTNDCEEQTISEGCSLNCKSGLNDKCVFDTCRSLGSQCSLSDSCIYTLNKTCHYGTCEDIGENESDCNLNDKCVIMNGLCTLIPCGNGSGLESGWCEWGCKLNVDGWCVLDPCAFHDVRNGSYSSCLNDQENSCIYDENRCKVDPCSLYNSKSVCVEHGGDGCIYNGVNCVLDICESLGNDLNLCATNERCVVITGKCSSNPCKEVECDENLCLYGSEFSSAAVCFFDPCATFLPTDSDCGSRSGCVMKSGNGGSKFCISGDCVKL
jgi:hypothetical protein